MVREVFSGTILAAKNLKSGSASELMVLLQPVKDLGFPVIGLVSDGQQSIRMAKNPPLTRRASPFAFTWSGT